MDNPDWQTIAAMKGLPVLFLPETSREAVLLLDQYLRQGEVLLKTGQLQDLQAALDLLQVSLGLQVDDIIQGYSLNAAFFRDSFPQHFQCIHTYLKQTRCSWGCSTNTDYPTY